MVLFASLLGCVPPHALAATPAPAIDGESMQVVGLPAWPGASWWPFLRAGDEVSGVAFGGGATGVPDGLDANTLHRRGERLFLLTHFERSVGALFVTELGGGGGSFTPTRTTAIDQAGVPVFNPCGAALSPWGSHLGSEEYEPDAGALAVGGRMRTPIDRGWGEEAEADNGWNARVDQLPAASVPYQHGWANEVTLDAEGRATFARRLALGRYSHEQAIAVSAREVYLSDDQANGGGLFRFLAAADADLRVGRLEAAAWHAGGSAGELGRLSWVELGPTSEAALLPAWQKPPSFDQLFERSRPTGNVCSSGTLVEGGSGRECLKLRAGQADLARAFETRRYAALLGATTIFPKEEGLAWDPESDTLFVAWSRVNPAAATRLGVPVNRCGQVVAVDRRTGMLRAALTGVPRGADGCEPTAIANPDNLAWDSSTRTLFVAEDGPSREGRNRLWAWRDGTLRALLDSPKGAEVSGLSVAQVGLQRWLTVSLQRDVRPSVVGFVGPW